jgi:hypothetical protein
MIQLQYPMVTLAIITRNRVESLKRTLRAISKLNYPNFEVLVINNASTDSTKSVIQEFNFTYFFSPKSNGFAKTRQIAVNAAAGEFILWCDDDAVPVIGWIEAYVSRFQADKDIALIAGKIINHGFPKNMKFKGLQVITSNGYLQRVDSPYNAFIFSNLNMAQRMSVMNEIGGYDPFYSGGYEEVDLNLCIRRAGYKVVYEEKATVDHYHSVVSFKKGRLFYGSQMMRLYLYFKHKNILENEGFVIKELFFLGRDIWTSVKISLSGIKRLDSLFLYIGLIELFNSLSSRIVLPWIVWKVNKFK